MIGHRRMTDVTHALETLLDGVRKNSIRISALLIDLCLNPWIACGCFAKKLPLRQSLIWILRTSCLRSRSLLKGTDRETSDAATPPRTKNRRLATYPITPFRFMPGLIRSSMASAARAFQLMMALQDLGEILTMSPSQEEIEFGIRGRKF